MRAITTGAVCVVAALAVGGYFLFGTGGGKSAAATPSTSPSATASASSTSSAAAVSEPAHSCTYTKSGTAARTVKLPSATPDYKATYQTTIVTNRGTIVIDLANSKATCTVNSFVSLAKQSFFSNTKCHRLTTSGIYVLQCGDPTGTGEGGPGYAFGNENLTGAKYNAGTVAMANTGAANSNGSQFFLVYKNSPPSRPATRRSARSSRACRSSRPSPRPEATTPMALATVPRRKASSSRASPLSKRDAD